MQKSLYLLWCWILPGDDWLDCIVERWDHGVEHFTLDELLLAVHEELRQPSALLLVCLQLVANLAGALVAQPALLRPGGQDAPGQ